MAQNLLFVVLMLFSCTIGYKMSIDHTNVWTVVIFNVAAVVSLQTSYALGLIIGARHG